MEDKWDIVEFAQYLAFLYGIGGSYFNSIRMIVFAYIMMAVITLVGLKYGKKRLAFEEKEESLQEEECQETA